MQMPHPSIDWTQIILALIALAGSVFSGLFAMWSRRASDRAGQQAGRSSFHATLAQTSASVAQQSADVALRASMRHPRVPTIPTIHEDDVEPDPGGGENDEGKR
jgi:hypothetical protein